MFQFQLISIVAIMVIMITASSMDAGEAWILRQDKASLKMSVEKSRLLPGWQDTRPVVNDGLLDLVIRGRRATSVIAKEQGINLADFDVVIEEIGGGGLFYNTTYYSYVGNSSRAYVASFASANSNVVDLVMSALITRNGSDPAPTLPKEGIAALFIEENPSDDLPTQPNFIMITTKPTNADAQPLSCIFPFLHWIINTQIDDKKYEVFKPACQYVVFIRKEASVIRN